MGRTAFAPVDRTKSVTFVVTEDCNLRCAYCYVVHKARGRRMPFDVAKAAVDYLLTERELFPEPGVIWDFLGGEPLLEVSLIERIVEYVLLRSHELAHPWFARSRFGITTNGLVYRTPAVQRFIERYRELLDITMSIDGPPHIHDRARVTIAGKGSFALIRESIPLWLAQFPHASTKVTIGRENLGEVAEAVLFLFRLGIQTVNANVVYEDVWQPGDDLVFEAQLDRLADEMVKTRLFETHATSLFQRDIGMPLDRVTENANWCGSGRMLAIDCEGTFYPCVRFMPFSLTKRAARPIGDIHGGLVRNRARPFLALTVDSQSHGACVDCGVARGCAWCQAVNYEEAASDTIYQRATFLCRMHKARSRANRRFWAAIGAVSREARP